MSVILQNKGIVVTRPKEQSAELIAELQRLGARAIAFPALQIDAPETWHSLDAALDQLDSFDWAVFTSRNAVHFALSRWQRRGQHTWPASVRVAAVGRESAKAIAEFGIEVALAPKRAGSEGLLENPEWQTVAGQRFALFAGDQGRELIQQTLEERGAMVEKIFCYRRVVPGANPTPLLHAWARGELDAVTVTTEEERELAELEPWLHQWHNQLDPVYGGSPAAFYTTFLDEQLQRHSITRQALTDWRPATTTGRGARDH